MLFVLEVGRDNHSEECKNATQKPEVTRRQKSVPLLDSKQSSEHSPVPSVADQQLSDLANILSDLIQSRVDSLKVLRCWHCSTVSMSV